MRTWAASVVVVVVVVVVASASACARAPRSMPAAPRAIAAARPCSDRLVAYRDWPQLEASGRFRWALDLPAAGGGHLVYLGVEHTDDPADPQFAAIDRAWAAARPTVAFFEGPDRPIAQTRDDTIRTTGESGYVRFLARRDGIPVVRLDPDPRQEAQAVLARHPADQVFLFFVLRELVRLRDRKGVPTDALPGVLAKMLAQGKQLGLPGMFETVDAFEAAYRTHLGAPAAWVEAPGWWFSPLPRAHELFTHRINRASSELRNRHMFEALSAKARTGERVFAVVGRNHVPMQEPALRCALAAP